MVIKIIIKIKEKYLKNMLDLYISFVNFLIIWIRSLINMFIFRPPNPQGYKLTKISKNLDPEEISFLIKQRDGSLIYKDIQYDKISYDYIKIPDKENNSFIPLLVIRPIDHKKICIIYSHGNSGDLGTSFFECIELSYYSKSCILLYDYPTFGECKNKPLTENNVYYNIRKTYDYAKNTLKYQNEQIFLYGFSLGTGISFDLACKNNVKLAGCILQAPFLSILRTSYDLKKTYFFDSFNSCDKAKNLKCPILIIHGNKDMIVPYIHGRILAKLIPKQYLYDFVTIQNANHNDIFKIKENKLFIYKRINEFISFCTNNDNNKKIDNTMINKNLYNEQINNSLYDYQTNKKNIDNKEYSANTASYRNKYDEIKQINMNDIRINLSNIIKKGYEIKTSFLSNDVMHDKDDLSFNQKENKVIKDTSITIDINENNF